MDRGTHLSRMLASHIVGYAWNCWNEERVELGLPELDLPVTPTPFDLIRHEALRMGVLHQTLLDFPVRLYRGYGRLDARQIRGLNSDVLTLDRVTSFTPFEDIARIEHGPAYISVILRSRQDVFADDSACGGCTDSSCDMFPGKCTHTGDRGIEVQLMPGTYQVVMYTPMIIGSPPHTTVSIWLKHTERNATLEQA
jgi:hypothetical protein